MAVMSFPLPSGPFQILAVLATIARVIKVVRSDVHKTQVVFSPEGLLKSTSLRQPNAGVEHDRETHRRGLTFETRTRTTIRRVRLSGR